MNLSLKNKHAFVCGGTDGIGKASALVMAEYGCEITLIARNENKLNLVLSELSIGNNQEHSSVCANFDDSEGLKNKIQVYLNKMDKPVDILINNSGGPHGGKLIEADEDEFRIGFERLLICSIGPSSSFDFFKALAWPIGKLFRSFFVYEWRGLVKNLFESEFSTIFPSSITEI